MKTEELQHILATTPREKALVVCKKWTEPFIYGEETPLSRVEVKTIIASLATEEERKEYNKWLSMYDVYSEVEELFSLGYVGLYRGIYRMKSYLYLWDSYEREVDTINVLFQAVRDSGSEEALELFKAAAASDRRNLFKARIEKTEEGYYTLNIFERGLLYDDIKESTTRLKKSYSELKALILAIEEFSRTTKSEDFNTRRIKECTAEVKAGCTLFNVPLRFSRERLRLRKEAGEETTEEDERRAVFPEYEELEVSPHDLKRYKYRVENLKRLLTK